MNNEMKAERKTMLLDKSWNQILREAQKTAAAESLQIRLKSDLRPDFSTDGLHQIQMVEPNSNGQHPQRNPATIEKKRKEGLAEQMPSVGIRKVSNKWGNENPFDTSKPLNITPNDQPSALNSTKSFDSQKKSLGGQAHPTEDMETFASVALNKIPEPRRVLRGSKSATRPNGDLPSHPYGKPLQAWPYTMGSYFHNKRSSTVQAFFSGGSKQSSGDGSSELSDEPVVVARAECTLAHPRPWRLSETKMLEDLVAGQMGSRRQEIRQKSRTSSQSQTSSFHTAREGDSG